MKTRMFLILAAAFVAANVSAQEVSSRGVQEVQASFSTLKVMIGQVKADLATVSDTANRALDKSTEALSTAKTAKKTADDAMTLADALNKCGGKLRFLDSQGKYRDFRDNDACVDAADVAGSASKKIVRFDMDDNDQVKSLGKADPMVINIACGTMPEQKCVGRPGEAGYSCIYLPVNYGVYFGKPGSQFKTVVQDKSKAGQSVVENYFVQGGTIYEGSVITTPHGNRVLGKKAFMDLKDWDGTVKFKNCYGTATAVTYQ